MVGILLTMAVTAIVLAMWPFGPYQISLLLARYLYRFPPTPDPAARSDASHLTFAICLCVYNEEAVISEKIADLLRLQEAAGGSLEILIYVDGASDRTPAILERYSDRITLTISKERRGKTYGMNLLVSQTTASIVLFTDANVIVDPTAVSVLFRYFSDASIGCVCAHLRYVNAMESATAAVGTAFWSFNEWSKGLETATGSVIGADGSLFAIRRRLHRPAPNGLFDDLYVSLGVLLSGFRVVRAPELKAYETHTTDAADEFRRKVRIACECMHVHFELWPELRKLDAWHLYKYVGHRLLRWIGGYLLAFGGLVLLADAAFTFGTLQVAILLIAALFLFAAAVRGHIGPAMAVWNVVLAFTGNTVGAWRAFRGERAITWELPASARSTRDRATNVSR